MYKSVRAIRDAFVDAPIHLRADLAFNGWLYRLTVELLSPAERAIVEVLAARGEQRTLDLVTPDTTNERVGSTLTELRRLKIVHTIRSHGEAWHDLTGYMRTGADVVKGVPHG